jgi:hypothetical protein
MALAVVVVIDAGGGTGDPGRDDAASEMQTTGTESRSYDDDGEGAAYAGSPPIGTDTPGIGEGVGDADSPGKSNAPFSPTPAPGVVASAVTPTPAAPIEATPTGDGSIVQSNTDDGSGEAYSPDEGSAADRTATSSDGDNDLLVIEIILGVAAALVLLASVVVARSKRQST